MATELKIIQGFYDLVMDKQKVNYNFNTFMPFMVKKYSTMKDLKNMKG